MKNFVIAAAAGAIVGATVSMVVPQDKCKFKNRVFKKGKRSRYKIVREIAGFMCKVI